MSHEIYLLDMELLAKFYEMNGNQDPVSGTTSIWATPRKCLGIISIVLKSTLMFFVYGLMKISLN